MVLYTGAKKRKPIYSSSIISFFICEAQTDLRYSYFFQFRISFEERPCCFVYITSLPIADIKLLVYSDIYIFGICVSCFKIFQYSLDFVALDFGTCQPE